MFVLPSKIFNPFLFISFTFLEFKVLKLGLDKKYCSTRAINTSVLSLAKNKNTTLKKLILAGKKAIEIDPVGRMEWEGWLIFCYISKKDLDNALNSINRTIQDAPHNRLFGFKAAVLALMGDIEESKVWLKKYTDERPEVKTIADYRKVAPEMSEALTNNLIEGMKLAGLPE